MDRRTFVTFMGLGGVASAFHFDLANEMATVEPPAKVSKKLIEYNSKPFPDWLNQNIQQIEMRPFDGLVVRLNSLSGGLGSSKVFTHQPYDLKRFDFFIQSLQATKFSKFTDNFVEMWATADLEWDWFSETDWQAAEQNVRLVARTAKEGGCIGISFDPEAYLVPQSNANPWTYPTISNSRNKSFEEYWTKVRERGCQFIQVIQDEFPGIKILCLYHMTMFMRLLKNINPWQQIRHLSPNDGFVGKYSLWHPFINGMLDAAEPNTIFIDGNERAYYYEGRFKFFEAYHLMRQKALDLIEPQNYQKYATQVQAGQALHLDHLLAQRKNPEKYISYYLTPEERLKFLEHNTYHALYTTDEYVWVWSAGRDWWDKKATPDSIKAIKSARNKIENGLPLDIYIGQIIQRARRKQQQGQGQ